MQKRTGLDTEQFGTGSTSRTGSQRGNCARRTCLIRQVLIRNLLSRWCLLRASVRISRWPFRCYSVLRTGEITLNNLGPCFQTAIPCPVSATEKVKPNVILVVEDEALVREITCEVLEDAGYRVMKARNAGEAHHIWNRCGKIIDVLLTDMVLPDQNGGTLAEFCRSSNSDLHVIFTSGYPQGFVSEDSIQKKGVSYLPKPFSCEGLLREIRDLLSQETS